MISKFFLAFFSIFAFSLGALPAFSPAVSATQPEQTVHLYLFWGDGCPHCARAKQVLEPYIEQHSNIKYYTFEVYYDSENQKLMQDVGERLSLNASGVPLIIVGDTPFVGFSDTTGDQIKQRLTQCSTQDCPDSIAEIVDGRATAARDRTASDNAPADSSPESKSLDTISLPLIGTINPSDISLPLLTVMFGLLDGFNPCAMWALLFIITLLIGMNDRKKMWLLGTTFIVTSAAVYFVFMAAWLNLFMFIGHIMWIRVLIGLLALFVGAYYLYDWYQNRTGCKVTGSESRQRIFTKLREIVKQNNIWLAMGGIILLAAAVNIVELACSAGLPVLYTGILSSAVLTTWQYYGYMLLYILFFMLDDLIVFAIAMTTFKIVGIDSKYTKAVRLVGGTLMCILGLLLLFAPQVLMFG